MASYARVENPAIAAVIASENDSHNSKSGRRVLFLFYVSTIILFICLAIAIVVVEAVTEARVCSETAAADEYCGQTKYSALWGGALFCIVIASFTIRLLLFKSHFYWRLWTKYNQGVTVIALCGFATVLGLNGYEANSKFLKLYDLSKEATSDAVGVKLSSIDCDNEMVLFAAEFRKNSLFDITFFMGCASKLCIAGMLVLLAVLHLVVPAVYYRKSKRNSNRSITGQVPETLPLQPMQPLESVAAVPNAPLDGDDVNRIAETGENVVLDIVEDQQSTLQEQPVRPPYSVAAAIDKAVSTSTLIGQRSIVVAARFYELARNGDFFKTLQTAYNVVFESNEQYNPDSTDSHVTISCRPIDATFTVTAEDETRALEALQRYVERCLKPRAKPIVVRFPVVLRDEVANLSAYISKAIDAALSGRNLRYVQLQVEKRSAQVGVLCISESESEVEQQRLREAVYSLHRSLRGLTLELSELDSFFETRNNVAVFSLVGERRPCRIYVYTGEVWRVPVDFVVNSVNTTLQFDNVSGLAAQLHRAAGSELAGELERVMGDRRGRSMTVGEVVSTIGCQLPAARVLHVHAPNSASNEYSEPDLLQLALQQLYGSIFNAACIEAPSEADDLSLALSPFADGSRLKFEDCFDQLLLVLSNGAGGSLSRFAQVHIVDVDTENVNRMLQRLSSKEFQPRFSREPAASNVRLVKPGAQVFVYTDVETRGSTGEFAVVD